MGYSKNSLLVDGVERLIVQPPQYKTAYRENIGKTGTKSLEDIS